MVYLLEVITKYVCGYNIIFVALLLRSLGWLAMLLQTWN